MPDILLIEIQNKLVNHKKSIKVYHHVTGITDIIGYKRSITLPLRTFIDNRNPDYIRIELKNEPDDATGEIIINLPDWIDFDLSFHACMGLTVSHSDSRTILNISPGSPTWKLKISRPGDSSIQTGDHIKISDIP